MSVLPTNNGNGRIVIGLKEILTVLTLVFMAGGAYFALNAQAQDISELEHEVDEDHDMLLNLRGKVDKIDDNVADIKVEQQMQKKMLQDIWIGLNKRDVIP